MLLGIEHVNFTCSDLDQTLHFYCDLLGFKLVLRRVVDNGSTVVFLEAGNGAQLEIVAPAGEVATPGREIPRTEVGLKHIALTVDDVDATYAQLSAAGVEFTIQPRMSSFQDILFRLCMCKGPDGVMVEFCQRAASRA